MSPATTWQTRPLGWAIATMESGASVNSDKDEEPDFSAYPCVLKTGAVKSGRLYPAESKKVARRDLNRLRVSLRENTILVSRMNTADLVGECGYIADDFPNLYVPDRMWMTTVNEERADARWLGFVLNWKPVKSQICGAATGTSGSMKNISKPSFRAVGVSYPPVPEQRSIAAALADADALIEALDELIVKKRDMKQGAMQALLTGKIRIPGFSKPWHKDILGNLVARIHGGGTPARSNASYWGGPIPWVTVKDLSSFSPVATQEYITTDGLDASPGGLVAAGTLILATRILVGKAVIFDVNVAINQDLKALTLGPLLRGRFLRYWFDLHGSLLAARAGGSTVMGVSVADVRGLELTFPTVAEQDAIVHALDAMERELDTLRERKDKLRLVQNGMAQALLSGRVRLKSQEASVKVVA